MTTSRRPSVPTGMGRTRGGSLWREIVGGYALRVDELRLLEEACRQVDLIDRMAREVEKSPLTVPGSMGQPVPNPLLAELRGSRQLLQRLFRQLNLPDDPKSAEVSAMERSTAARSAARARWGSR
jgi:hypothetical protein